MSVAEAYKRVSKANESRKSISYSRNLEVVAKKEQSDIEKFLLQKDLPPWHRGVSVFQTVAAINILNALRDDAEQRTTHRVRACIAEIGLVPLINSRQVKFLMRLSRGNDLAFLWFLMELHYKTPSPIYNLNEQLIMSSIANLDMITTLRELDRLLPPGHPPLAEIERLNRIKIRQRKQEELKAKLRLRRHNQPRNVLPYFRRLARPRFYGKSLYISVPGFKVNFGPYEQYKNPHYIVQNELNRWYADYDIVPSRRIVKRILNDELENLFEDVSVATLKSESLKPMCGHHRDILALEESLKDKLRVIARDRCLKMLDLGSKKKEAVRLRIMDQLEQEIGKYVCKFHKIARKSQGHCRVKILPNECTGYDLKLVDDSSENDDDDEHSDESCRAPRPSGLLEHHESIDVDRDFRRESGGNIFMLSEKKVCPQKQKEPCTTGLCLDERINIKKEVDEDDDMLSSSESQTQDLNDSPTKSPAKGHVSISTAAPGVCLPKPEQDYNYGHSDATTPTESQTFFNAPRNNKPYEFNYQKIFRFKSMVKRLNIRKTFVNALNSKMELPSRELGKPIKPQQKMQPQEDETHRPNITDAISRCVCRIWKNQVTIKNIELEKEAERIRNFPEVDTKSPLGYEHKYYDPNDHNLMLKMLKDALEYMSKNPKFVLAGMPESYKLPVLREWIAHRYGKVYSRMERYRSLQMSIKIFRALNKLNIEIAAPSVRELGPNLKVNYSCHDYLIKKAKRIQKEYYNRLDTVSLDYTRVFWFAMNPYLCSGGPPRNTFFAYMPSNITNIKRFRIWKETDFVNVKDEWERKMSRKAKAAALPI